MSLWQKSLMTCVNLHHDKCALEDQNCVLREFVLSVLGTQTVTMLCVFPHVKHKQFNIVAILNHN